MKTRRGLGKGRGKGYKNINFADPKIHADSAKGKKQPQKIPACKPINLTKTKQIAKVSVHSQEGFLLREHNQLNDFLRKRFKYYPKCSVIKQHEDLILLCDVDGNPLDIPIQRLNKEQKKKLASVVQYLFQSGHLVSDLEPEMVYLDKKDNPVIVDLSGIAIYDPDDPQQMKRAEREYNYVILSIFGRKDAKPAKQYMTLKPQELSFQPKTFTEVNDTQNI